MAQIGRKTIAEGVARALDDCLESAHNYLDQDAWAFKAFSRDTQQLANASPFDSFMAKAVLYHLSGDLEGALKWIKNGHSYPAQRARVDRTEAVILSNLGHFSKARDTLLSMGIEHIGLGEVDLHFLTCCLQRLAERATEGQDSAEDSWITVAKTVETYTMTLARLHLSETDVAAVLDLAGAVLRKHRIFFEGAAPVIRTSYDGILYQLKVRVDARTSVDLTEEVLEAMVEHDLDKPGLAFSFIPA